MFQLNKINATILAVGIALAPFLPEYAHAATPRQMVSATHRSGDPIGDIIAARMGWDAPAPVQRSTPKPKKPKKPAPVTQPAASAIERSAAEKAGAAASRAAHDAEFAMAFGWWGSSPLCKRKSTSFCRVGFLFTNSKILEWVFFNREQLQLDFMCWWYN